MLCCAVCSHNFRAALFRDSFSSFLLFGLDRLGALLNGLSTVNGLANRLLNTQGRAGESNYYCLGCGRSNSS
jgi:hypothetical protein